MALTTSDRHRRLEDATSLAEERLQTLYRFTYTPAARSTAQRCTKRGSRRRNARVGNVGTEGVSFDPRDGTFVTVKEKTPQRSDDTRRLRAGTATSTSIFAPSGSAC